MRWAWGIGVVFNHEQKNARLLFGHLVFVESIEQVPR